MGLLRVVAALLPQLLLLLLVGGRFDLLAGWNHTDAAFSTLVVLAFSTPAVTAALLTVETIRHRMAAGKAGDRRSSGMLGLATMLFIEALGIDLLLLFQLTMH